MSEETLSSVGPQRHKKKYYHVTCMCDVVSSVEAFVSIDFYENLYERAASESYVTFLALELDI